MHGYVVCCIYDQYDDERSRRDLDGDDGGVRGGSDTDEADFGADEEAEAADPDFQKMHK